ncbi:MAG TPA: D-alanyl-D-alanine carboxypeptidase family protein [Gammaproteobacteria bacterium]|nr:D-alanyl-D-alanine carboxypeptidase family protein [Gammaproteobacteria bacterium]
MSLLRTFARDVCLAFALVVAAQLAAEESAVAPVTLPKVNAKSYYLIDFSTDKILSANAADEQLAPASLTKLMTAYVVFGALESGRIRLDDTAHVSAKAWRTGGTRMFIDVNSDVAIDDLLHGLLIQSGNDAAVALAEHVAGSVDAFVVEMNAAAQKLGMRNSAFKNPHGLPARGHYTTARDLAVLAKAIIEEFPGFYGIYAEREFSYNGIAQNNRNALLSRDPSVDGLKTGYTDSAGYCLVSSAKRDGMRLIAVVLGAPSPRVRNEGAQKLLEYGFANFETHKLYSAGQELDNARVWGGEVEFARLGITEDIYVTIPRGSYPKLAAKMDVLAQLAAPLVRGTAVGEVNISFDGATLVKTPVIVLANVLDGGVWARMRDELDLLWE